MAWGLDAVSELLGHRARQKTDDVSSTLHGRRPPPTCARSISSLTQGPRCSPERARIDLLARRSTLDVYAPFPCANNATASIPHDFEVATRAKRCIHPFIDTPGLGWQPSLLKTYQRKRMAPCSGWTSFCPTKSRIDRRKDRGSDHVLRWKT